MFCLRCVCIVFLCVNIRKLSFCLFVRSLCILFWLFCSIAYLFVFSLARSCLCLFAWWSVLCFSCRYCGVVVLVVCNCVVLLACMLDVWCLFGKCVS